MIEDAYRSLETLLPDPANYNRHSAENVAILAAQINEVGFTAPFLVDAATGILAAGHRRRLALLKLKAEHHAEPAGVRPGWEVPCRVGTWTELQRLKVLVGDNPDPAALDYDAAGLTRLLTELNAQGELAGSGYDEGRLEALIAELAATAPRGDGTGVDPQAEWQGMPEFEQPDVMPYRTLNVHFADEEAAQDFAALIGQALTDKTKYVWHPEQRPQSRLGLQYVSDESEVSDLHHQQGSLEDASHGASPNGHQCAVPSGR